MPKFTDWTGKKIGRLKFISHEFNGHKRRWTAICECGNTQSYRVDYFSTLRKKGKIFECFECKMRIRSPIVLDKKYGRLTILERDRSCKKKGVWYLCQCECGNKTTVLSQSLSHPTKPTRSCGCYMRKIHSRNCNTTQYPPAHGMRTNAANKENLFKKRIYNMRTSLAAACYNPTNSRYSRIGKKGYTLCDLWRNGVKDFYYWVLENGYELGKAIYINKGEFEYGPSTCYLDWRDNHTKITNSKMITFRGKTQSLSDWGKELGLTPSGMSLRFKKYKDKYGIDKAMNTEWKPSSTQTYGTEHFEPLIVKLYKEGKTYKEITQQLGCSSSTIKRFLVKNNVFIRPAAHIPKRKNIEREIEQEP